MSTENVISQQKSPDVPYGVSVSNTVVSSTEPTTTIISPDPQPAGNKPLKFILVGAGFLGSYILRDILRPTQQDTLLVVDKRNKASVFAHPSLKSYEKDPRLTFKWMSMADGIRIMREMKEADVIINTSAIADVPYALAAPQDTVNTNITNMVQFMEAVRASEFSGRLIHLSSESIYGHQPVEKLPIKESDAVPQPANIYGVSKLAQELVVRSYNKSYGIKTVVLRSGTLYGPGGRPDQAIPIFMRQALMNEPITLEGDGSQTRDFNYVTNMMDAVHLASRHPNGDIDGEIFNISSGRETSFAQLTKVIRTISQSQSTVVNKPWRPGEHGLRVVLDISKAREKLGYEPKIDLIQGGGLRNTMLYIAREVLHFPEDELVRLQRTLGIINGLQQVGTTETKVQQ